MIIDLIKFHANGKKWTLVAEVDGMLETISGGFIDGFPTFEGVDFRPLPIGRTTLVVDMLVDALDGQNAGRLVPLAVLFGVSGVAWNVPIFLRGEGVSVGSLLLIVSGLLFFLLGLITEMLSNMRRDRIDQ